MKVSRTYVSILTPPKTGTGQQYGGLQEGSLSFGDPHIAEGDMESTVE